MTTRINFKSTATKLHTAYVDYTHNREAAKAELKSGAFEPQIAQFMLDGGYSPENSEKIVEVMFDNYEDLKESRKSEWKLWAREAKHAAAALKVADDTRDTITAWNADLDKGETEYRAPNRTNVSNKALRKLAAGENPTGASMAEDMRADLEKARGKRARVEARNVKEDLANALRAVIFQTTSTGTFGSIKPAWKEYDLAALKAAIDGLQKAKAETKPAPVVTAPTEPKVEAKTSPETSIPSREEKPETKVTPAPQADIDGMLKALLAADAPQEKKNTLITHMLTLV